jgi:Mn-dependent DtxR family transcriptional regulator
MAGINMYTEDELPTEVLLARLYYLMYRAYFSGRYTTLAEALQNHEVASTVGHCRLARQEGLVKVNGRGDSYKVRLTEKGVKKVKSLHIKLRLLGEEGKYVYNDSWR